MCTPNGRFRTNVKLCSMSGSHPERWLPIWGVSSILVALLSLMLGSEDTFGDISIETSEADKIKMAKVWLIELFLVEHPRLKYELSSSPLFIALPRVQPEGQNLQRTVSRFH
mmetsp:Transcript_13776/g.19910  ORF Transcript_13776/g.19910 Transcript_13776/m.19910 type:complete len:112 (-) Transcript_13776:952-1287(-)